MHAGQFDGNLPAVSVQAISINMIDIARAVRERLTLLLVLLASIAMPTIVEYIQSFVMRKNFDIEQTVLVSLLLAVIAIPLADLVEIKARLQSRRAPLASKIRKALLVTTTLLLLITIIVYATVHALPSDQTNTYNIFLAFIPTIPFAVGVRIFCGICIAKTPP